MIGNCESCNRRNIPIVKGKFGGMETTQCFICMGNDDNDPYKELVEVYSAPPFCKACRLDHWGACDPDSDEQKRN